MIVTLCVGLGSPIIGGAVAYRVAKMNKLKPGVADIREDDALHVRQYKEQTETALKLVSETRENAESALRIQRELLELARGQVASLSTTIDQLRSIIADLQSLHEASASTIAALRDELARNIEQRDLQRGVILAKEAEIAEREVEIARLVAAVDAAEAKVRTVSEA